jgi:predicted GIY-YIG superfamily endonuclease
MSAGTYWVYILASRRNGTLYIGVTNNLKARLEQHRAGLGSEFVKKYGVHRLVHGRIFIAAGCNRTREAGKELATGFESSADRKGESGVE